MPREIRYGFFGNDRPGDKRPEDYEPPARQRAGEDIPPDDNDEEASDGQDETDRVTT